MSRVGAPRGWARGLMKDGPARSGSGQRVWCAKCFEIAVKNTMMNDQALVAAQQRSDVRDRATVEEALWGLSKEQGSGAFVYNSDAVQNHLRKCMNQPDYVRQQAEDEYRRPKRRAERSSTPQYEPEPPTWDSSSHTAGPSWYRAETPELHPNKQRRLNASHESPHMDSSTLGISLAPPYQQQPLGSPFLQGDAPLGPPYHASVQNLRARGPSPQPSRASSPGVGPSNTGRRSSTPGVQFANTPLGTPMDQERFEISLARVTASLGLAYRWPDDPEVNKFFSDFIPWAKVPSRQTLTKKILPKVLKGYRDKAKANIRGSDCTVSCDGWTGGNGRHVLAFMATAKHEVHAVKVFDTTNERRTAETQYKYMCEVIDLLEREWGVQVVAFCSDASGESRKGRLELAKNRPHIVVPDCFSHQINLIVGNYFEADDECVSYSKQALTLITWLRSKSFVLSLLAVIQHRLTAKMYSIIRPVLVRWTSHYLAYRRLLQLEQPIKTLLIEDKARGQGKSQLATGPASAKTKAQEAMDIIEDGDFWHYLRRMTVHLRPLAVAANMTQGATTRLDHCLMTFAQLYYFFSRLPAAEKTIADAVLASIEKRWRKCDREVFIAAVILNPYLKTRPFAANTLISGLNLMDLMLRLYNRFFKDTSYDTPKDRSELQRHFLMYHEESEEYAPFFRVTKDTTEQDLPPSRFWAHTAPGNRLAMGGGPLCRLALRILSIFPNSASVERLFSAFGNTLTKLRSRLGLEPLLNQVELKMHLRIEQAKLTGHKRLKRNVLERDLASTAATPDATQSSFPNTTNTTPDSSLLPSPRNQPQITMPAQTATITESALLDGAASTLDLIDDEVTEVNDIGGSSTGGEFEAIRNQLSESLREDSADDGQAPVETAPESFKKTIKDLFDFDDDYWKEGSWKLSDVGLDMELALHELLDMDAPGETVEDNDGDEV